MDKFRRADVEGSLEDFNQALQLDPQLRPYLWQRGLSLFYTGLSHCSHCVDMTCSGTRMMCNVSHLHDLCFLH